MDSAEAWTRRIDGTPVPGVGGKGAGLVRLVAAGAPVPSAFVVTTDAFRAAVGERAGRLDTELAGVPVTANEFAAHCAAARQEVYEATEGHPVLDEVVEDHRRLAGEGGAAVAVRSSSSTEDSATASFAGEHDTYLWVDGPDAVTEAVRRCWASLYNDRAVAYRRQVGTAAATMAVVVQQMVDADAAGVLMTLNPANGDRSSIVVESVWGLGEPLVSGEVTPDRFVLEKVTGQCCRRDIAAKPRRMARAAGGGQGVGWHPVPEAQASTASLSDAHLAELWRLGRLVEGAFGRPVDIEFVVADRVLLVQARPETTWSGRAAVAAPGASSAVQLVLATLTSPVTPGAVGPPTHPHA